MFDIGWSELMLIGIVALIVIGPKELPAVLRTVGRTVAKVRRMAGEFQGQFQEALREAEIVEMRKEISGIADDARASFTKSGVADAGLGEMFDPLKAIRDEIRSTVESAVKPPVEALPPAGTAPARPHDLAVLPPAGGLASTPSVQTPSAGTSPQ